MLVLAWCLQLIMFLCTYEYFSCQKCSTLVCLCHSIAWSDCAQYEDQYEAGKRRVIFLHARCQAHFRVFQALARSPDVLQHGPQHGVSGA